MINILYKIKESPIHGIGLFADQNIKKGDLIYTPNSILDININNEEFDNLNPSEKKEVEYYGYFNKKTKKWHVAFDMVKVLNHGDEEKANVTQNKEMILIAKREIEKGEELLQNYKEIYPEEGEHFKRIKSKSL